MVSGRGGFAAAKVYIKLSIYNGIKHSYKDSSAQLKSTGQNPQNSTHNKRDVLGKNFSMMQTFPVFKGEPTAVFLHISFSRCYLQARLRTIIQYKTNWRSYKKFFKQLNRVQSSVRNQNYKVSNHILLIVLFVGVQIVTVDHIKFHNNGTAQ